MKGSAQVFGDARGIVDLGDPLRDLTKEGLEVYLLEGFAVPPLPGYLPEEQDHRRRILTPDMQPGRSVRRPRTPCRHHDSRPSRELPPGFGGHRRPAFLPADRHLDRAVIERVEKRQIALAGDAKGPLDAVPDKRISENLSAGAKGCGRSVHVLLASDHPQATLAAVAGPRPMARKFHDPAPGRLHLRFVLGKRLQRD